MSLVLIDWWDSLAEHGPNVETILTLHMDGSYRFDTATQQPQNLCNNSRAFTLPSSRDQPRDTYHRRRHERHEPHILGVPR